MLPNIPNYIIELPSLEIVYGIGRKPILQIDISDLPMLPV